ncbi:FAD-dependent oxidoreductase [Pontiella sulfatireligans]|uniref:Succinate dehydrogenase flavoprotein subunit n=1 Tax=Pontiella sulfatireligans TaxID=2750658 RepID=A0A6C2ULU6_9BACT|nr:FAD-binding protein [Pontiella sulfatireligans]VGO20321.1 Succinate dehydrogenase flavoprotein subunit [Pontiella sulfatireligans]
MNPLNSKFKRRGFMGVVGGSCAVISTVAFGQHQKQPSDGGRPSMPPGGRGASTKKKKAAEGKINQLTTDVLVVGGGMAGVFAAVKAHDRGAKVLLVDKGAVGKSGQTPFARGIFRFDEKDGMAKAEYLKKTAEAAEYMNNPIYTELVLDQSATVVDELESWGFFKEATYAKAMNHPLKERNIPVIERCMLTHLLEEGGRVAGAAGLFIDQNESIAIHAKSVILCTGASGFKPTGWQIGSLTSDGDAMAYRIGAEITGKEWVDGHGMTNFGLEGLPKTTGSNTEEIRGMLGVEQNIAVEKSGPSSGGMMGPPPRGRGGSGGDRRGPPPGGDKMAGGHGGGPGGPPGGGSGGGKGGPGGGHGGPPMGTSGGGVSAGMSQHKAEGLFPQDDKCSSNIPGLYGAGDALGSMQTGGIYTQVGGSLAGSAAQGALAGKTAAEYAKGSTLAKVTEAALTQVNADIYAPYLRDSGFSSQWVTQTLQGVMIPNFILYVKSEERLQAALTYIEYLRDHQVPLLKADDLHELRLCHETANMVLNAEMKLRASLMRKESRGSHYREDYPERNDNDWLCWIKIRQAANGNMELLKHSIKAG